MPSRGGGAGGTAEVGSLLPRRLYRAAPERVARALLGSFLVQDPVVLRISEVEAYGGPEDSASHARFGRTDRNAPMWEDGGRIYLFICYGIHRMLNVVTGPEGAAGAVLIRACEPVAGEEIWSSRRGGRTGPDGLAGPGRVGAALGLDQSWSRHRVFEAGGMEVRGAAVGTLPESRVASGPRVGIDYAEPSDRRRPWRFGLADSRWVTHRHRFSAGPERHSG